MFVGQTQCPGGLAPRAPLVEQPLEPHQTADPGHQGLVVNRLGQEIVRARFQAAQPLGRLTQSGHHDDGDVEGD